MSEQIAVENTSFVRDIHSKGLMNTDLKARQMHRENLMRLEKERLQQINTRDEVKQLKEDVNEIKQSLEKMDERLYEISKQK